MFHVLWITGCPPHYPFTCEPRRWRVCRGHGSFRSWVLLHPVRHEKGTEDIDGNEDDHRLFLNGLVTGRSIHGLFPFHL